MRNSKGKRRNIVKKKKSSKKKAIHKRSSKKVYKKKYKMSKGRKRGTRKKGGMYKTTGERKIKEPKIFTFSDTDIKKSTDPNDIKEEEIQEEFKRGRTMKKEEKIQKEFKRGREMEEKIKKGQDDIFKLSNNANSIFGWLYSDNIGLYPDNIGLYSNNIDNLPDDDDDL